MAQLIEVDSLSQFPLEIYMAKEDMLFINAGGGNVLSGKDVIERFGPYVTALLQENGTSLAPMGGPNKLLFVARQQGTARVAVVMGDPWHSPHTVEVEIIVGP